MTLLLTSSVEGVLLVLAGVVTAGAVTTWSGSCRVSGVVPPFALPTGSFVGAARDSVASLKAVVTQIVGLDQVVLSFEAPVSVAIAPGQAVSCAGASRTAAKCCGG